MQINNTQRLVSDISGYCGLGESGAKDDGYYNIDNSTDRLIYMREYLLNAADYDLDVLDQTKAFDFLETDLNCEFNSESDRYHSFKAL